MFKHNICLFEFLDTFSFIFCVSLLFVQVTTDHQTPAPMDGIYRTGKVFSVKKSQPILVQSEGVTRDEEFYFLSNLDQNIAVIIQTVYCFKQDDMKCSKNVANVIKQALAKVLVHFYPLAGNLTISPDGKLIVECSNDGVPFVEAVADCSIDVLGDITIPDPVILGELVHTIPGAKNILEMPLLTAQVLGCFYIRESYILLLIIILFVLD